MQPENVQNVLDVLDILDVLNVLNVSVVTLTWVQVGQKLIKTKKPIKTKIYDSLTRQQ